MTMDGLRKRLGNGENATTEFVLDSRSIASIGKTIAAFLNGDGGAIYCGVDNDGVPVGLTGNVGESARAIESRLKTAISPTAFFTAEVIDIDGRAVIVLEVPQGKDRPYVFEGGVWLRQGNRTEAADVATLRRMLQLQGEVPERWERRLSPSMLLEDLDPDEVRTTVREAESAGKFSFTDRSDDLAVLRDLSVYATGGFTQGGDVLFARMPTRRHPQCRAQLVRFTGEKTSDTYADNRWFEGPLVRVCTDLIGAIGAAIPVRSVFPPGEARRVDRPTYDLDAVREGIVNAFVHRDYSAYSGGLRVSMFEGRIEIWNSGRLPDGLTPGDLRQEHPSILINPDIAQVFYLRELMERTGRGTEKIVQASQGIGAAPPQWRDSPTGVTLTLFAATATASGKAVALNDRQNRLLLELQPDDSISPKAYRERYAATVTPRQARRDLEELESLGWLKREGQTRSIVYRLP